MQGFTDMIPRSTRGQFPLPAPARTGSVGRGLRGAGKADGQDAAGRFTKGNKKPLQVNDKEFNKGLEALARDFGNESANQYKRMMSDIEKRAKRRAPSRTGAMRSGTWWRVDREGALVVGTIGSSADYGKHTEFVDKPGGRMQTARQNNSKAYAGQGTVRSPFTKWPAQSGRGGFQARSGSGQTMPWLRPAFVDVMSQTLQRRLGWAFRDALRRRHRGK